jgi:hypothetical protein
MGGVSRPARYAKGLAKLSERVPTQPKLVA